MCSKLIVLDSLVVASKNSLSFRNRTTLQKGMYSIYVKNKSNIDFFISDSNNQHFTIDVDLNNPIQTLTFKDSQENQAYADYLRFIKVKQNQQQGPQVQAEIEQEWNELEKEYAGSMLALYIHTIRDPQIPDPKIPLIIKDHEQAMQKYYNNYLLNHFIDNIDFSDNRLLYMPVLEQKISFYFREIVNPVPDSVIARIDQILKRTNENYDVYNCSVRYLYNLFREFPIQGNTQIYNYIGENYILVEPSRWHDLVFVEKVSERIEKAKLNQVGSLATNLKLQTAEGKQVELFNIQVSLTVLYFFNPGCESCQPVTEALSAQYIKYKRKGIQVFAVYLGQEKEVWLNYIHEKKLDWINVYDPDGSAGIEKKYDIYATPLIYLLDKDKKVISRDIPINDLRKYLGGF